MRARATEMVVVVVASTLALTAAGCGSGTTAAPEAAAAVRLSVDDLPEPAEDDVVLTIAGGASNSDEGLRLSLEQLEQLGTTDITVYEPFVAEDVEFTVVPWAAVLELADLPDDVDVLHTVAFNEYEVDVPVAVADDAGAWLATRQDGEPIAVADGGPTRLVFDAEHPDAADEALWIWSVALIEPA